MRALIRSSFCLLVPIVIWAACASSPHNPAFNAYPASVSGHTSIIYYVVEGKTYTELSRSLATLGPKVSGTTYVGETRSPMRWGWRLESMGGSMCSIREVTVSMNAQVILPRWNPPEDADPALITEWKRFILALETHEAGHKDISANAGREIVNRLRGMTGLCSDINSRASEVARSIFETSSEQQRAYDAETRHGFTQGTWFGRPPPTQ